MQSDEFKLTINSEHFRETNGIWNTLMLNDPWSVGYVTNIIEQQTFRDKEEWEEFYYKTGMDRQRKISTLKEDEKKLLNDYQYIRTNKNLDGIRSDLKELNHYFGRTKEELDEKGRFMFSKLPTKTKNIVSETDCIEAVRFRVICETWNGVIIRERNTIRNLQNMFPQFSFLKASAEDDHKYAVDYFVKRGETLICALQIKPRSYLFNQPYIVNARSANSRKNNIFTELFQVNVFYVISKGNGEIIQWHPRNSFEIMKSRHDFL